LQKETLKNIRIVISSGSRKSLTNWKSCGLISPLFSWDTVLSMGYNSVMSIEKIKYALGFLLGKDDLVPALATVLDRCHCQQGIRFYEIKKIAGEEAEELLLLAWDWKLLLPRRSGQCAEWDDRIMVFKPEEYYEIPNIAYFLLELVADTGIWDIDTAVRSMFAHMGEAAYDRMPTLTEEAAKLAKNRCIRAADINSACIRTGLKNRTDAMIAALKGGGIISPKLKSGSPTQRSGSPVYEVHPVVIELYRNPIGGQ